MPAQNLPGLMLDYTHPLSRGLVGWWPMNEGAGGRVNDISGIGNHGAFSGVVPSTTSGWGGGPLGRAVQFDGSNDYISAPHSASLAIVGDMSISLFIYIVNAASYKAMVSKNATNVAKPYDYYIREIAADGKVAFIRGNGAASGSVTSAAAPAASRWNHLAVTMRGTAVTHYLNGATNGTGTISTTIGDGGDPVRIGTRADGLTGACVMFGIRIYNRALDAREVAQLYADPMAGALMPSRASRYFAAAPGVVPPAIAAPPTADRLWNRGYVGRIFRRGEKGYMSEAEQIDRAPVLTIVIQHDPRGGRTTVNVIDSQGNPVAFATAHQLLDASRTALIQQEMAARAESAKAG